MTIRLATVTQNAMANAWAALPDSGTVEIRTGAQPASANDAATGTLLATVDLEPDAYGASVTGTAPLNGTPLDAIAVADGTPGWARIYNSVGGALFDGSVGLTAADFLINDEVFVAGDIVRINAGSVIQPAG